MSVEQHKAEDDDRNKQSTGRNLLGRAGQGALLALSRAQNLAQELAQSVAVIAQPVQAAVRAVQMVPTSVLKAAARHLRVLQQAASATEAGARVAGVAMNAAMATSPLMEASILAALDLNSEGAVKETAKKLTNEQADYAAKAIAFAQETATQTHDTGKALSSLTVGYDLAQQADNFGRTDAHAEQMAPLILYAKIAPPVIIGVDLGDTRENTGIHIMVTVHDEYVGDVTKMLSLSAQNYELVKGLDIPFSYTDSFGHTVSTTIRVPILDVNEVPETPVIISTFDGQQLVITATAADPDGEILPSQTWTYTVQQLAAGAPSFTATFTDAGGLMSSALIDPPELAKQAALDSPVAPTMLGYSLASLPENQGGVLMVTAYDAVDGVIVRGYALSAQDHETTPQILQHVEIMNSAGLSTSSDVSITITDVSITITDVFDINWNEVVDSPPII